MRKFTLFLISLFALNLFADGKSSLSTADKFIRSTHTFQGSTLPYRFFAPEGIDPKQKYPLVIALHGMGERGTDNNLQLTANKMATCWAEPTIQAKNPCFVIAPQCPVTSGWTDSPVYTVLINLIETALSRFNIDKDRVYITGLSMGGNGTWNCICLSPDLFAAAVPIAGWGNTAKGPVIKNIPIWAFHGHSDNVVAVDNSRFMVEAVANQGIEPIYTNCFYADTRTMPIDELNNDLQARSSLIYSEMLGYYHDVWDYAYSYKAMFDWVFSKRKFIQNAITLSSMTKDTILQGTVSIKWNSTFPTDSVEIWFISERQEYWKLLKKELSGKKAFNWNADEENECIYGKVRICLIDSASRIYSQTESAPVTIDKAGNGLPYVKLKTPEFYKTANIISKRMDVKFIANDVESDSVWVVFDYSTNGGKTYSKIDSIKVSADNELKTHTILFSKLIKSNTAVLKLMVYDDKRVWSADSTMNLSNQLGIVPVSTPLARMNDGFYVSEPYPNPANEFVTVSFEMPVAGSIYISIYNSFGQLVFQKEAPDCEIGRNEVQIRSSSFRAGLYSYSVSLISPDWPGTFQQSKKLIIRH